MEFNQIVEEAIYVRKLYEQYELKKYGRAWTHDEIAMGFVGDVGKLMKILLSLNGVQEIPDPSDKLAHELVDCLWSIIVISKIYKIDLESSFMDTMGKLKEKLSSEISI